MSKNEYAKREYKITIKGISTNQFSHNFLENMLTTIVAVMDSNGKQVSVTIDKIKGANE